MIGYLLDDLAQAAELTTLPPIKQCHTECTALSHPNESPQLDDRRIVLRRRTTWLNFISEDETEEPNKS